MKTLTARQLYALLLIASGVCLRVDLHAHSVRTATLNSLLTKRLIVQRWHIHDTKRDYFHVDESAKEWLKAVVKGLGLQHDRRIESFAVDLDKSYTVNLT